MIRPGNNRNRLAYIPALASVLLPLALMVIALVLLSGCDEPKSKSEKKVGEEGISKEWERGPATMRIRFDKQEVSIADTLKMEVEVEVEEGYEVNMPKFGEKIQEIFGIIDYSTPPSKLLEDKKVLHKREYELEPLLSGDYKIPPLTAEFFKKGDKKKHKIESEELTIKVTSVIADKSKLELKDIVGPVEPEVKPKTWILYAGLGGFAGLGVLGLLAYFVFRPKDKPLLQVRRDPAELAYEEIKNLVAEGLVEKGEIKLFYLRLSGILRHYIERRFGLHAPERTTEEFLAELRDASLLTSEQKATLKKFLQHCDMVKFAEHMPETDEIQGAFDICKAFIEQTREAANA